MSDLTTLQFFYGTKAEFNALIGSGSNLKGSFYCIYNENNIELYFENNLIYFSNDESALNSLADNVLEATNFKNFKDSCLRNNIEDDQTLKSNLILEKGLTVNGIATVTEANITTGNITEGNINDVTIEGGNIKNTTIEGGSIKNTTIEGGNIKNATIEDLHLTRVNIDSYSNLSKYEKDDYKYDFNNGELIIQTLKVNEIQLGNIILKEENGDIVITVLEQNNN